MRTIGIPSTSGFPGSISTLGLCVFLAAFVAGVRGEQGKPTVKAVFKDVSETNLPQADLLGFSMDAESVDLDG